MILFVTIACRNALQYTLHALHLHSNSEVMIRMKGVIGNNLIAKLQPKAKQYDVRDTHLKGFLIRVTPAGKMSYVCQYSRGKRVNIGQVGVITPAQARDKAKQILSQAVMGILPKNNNSNGKLTLAKFIASEYETWRKANRKNGKDDLRRLKVNFVSEFGDYLLSEITPVVIEKWRTKRINDGIKATTVNRDIIILKSALSKAVEWEFIVENPLQKLKPFKIDVLSKIRYLTKEEDIRLKQALAERDAALKLARSRGNEWRKVRGYDYFPDLEQVKFSDHLTPMVLLSLNTGLRRGELLSLSWDKINLEGALLTIGGAFAKSGKTRHIPLNETALQVLKDWKIQSPGSSNLVFFNHQTGEAFGNIKRAWANISKIANIENFRWHDMRHHFASKLVMAGVDLNTVRELLGHADITMTLRYAHLAPEHKANAVAKLME